LSCPYPTRWIRYNMFLYVHTYHSRLIPKGQQRSLRYSFETPTFYQNDLGMRNTAGVTGGKPTAVYLRRECCNSFSRLLRHSWKKETRVLSRTLHENVFFILCVKKIRLNCFCDRPPALCQPSMGMERVLTSANTPGTNGLTYLPKRSR
jgi:hypothetical protein